LKGKKKKRITLIANTKKDKKDFADRTGEGSAEEEQEGRAEVENTSQKKKRAHLRLHATGGKNGKKGGGEEKKLFIASRGRRKKRLLL